MQLNGITLRNLPYERNLKGGLLDRGEGEKGSLIDCGGVGGELNKPPGGVGEGKGGFIRPRGGEKMDLIDRGGEERGLIRPRARGEGVLNIAFTVHCIYNLLTEFFCLYWLWCRPSFSPFFEVFEVQAIV